MNKPLIILTGPTAAGKTDISIKLAKRIGGEIISADSMQVYKRMNIGTAKITPEEMQGVKHHLIDVLEPTEPFNVAVFKELASKAADEIYERGNIPIIVGGTGFYIQALLYDINFSEEESDGYREELEKEAEVYGSEKLFEKLRAVDPASCDVIHPNNVKKVIRALEFYHYNGYPINRQCGGISLSILITFPSADFRTDVPVCNCWRKVLWVLACPEKRLATALTTPVCNPNRLNCNFTLAYPQSYAVECQYPFECSVHAFLS